MARDPSWDEVRADGRRAVDGAMHLTGRALQQARVSAKPRTRLRRGLRRIPGARQLARALRQQRNGAADR